MAGTTDTVKAKLTPGEFVIRKEAVDMIGVPMLNKLNDMPEEGGHSAIDNLIQRATLANMKMMYGGGMVQPNYAGGGMVEEKMYGYQNGGKIQELMEGLQQEQQYTMGAPDYGTNIFGQKITEPYEFSPEDFTPMGAVGSVGKASKGIMGLLKSLGKKRGVDEASGTVAIGKKGENILKQEKLAKYSFPDYAGEPLEMSSKEMSNVLEILGGRFPRGTIVNYPKVGSQSAYKATVSPSGMYVPEGYQDSDVVGYQQGEQVVDPNDPLGINKRQAMGAQAYAGSTIAGAGGGVSVGDVAESVEIDEMQKANQVMEALKLQGIYNEPERSGYFEFQGDVPQSEADQMRMVFSLLRDMENQKALNQLLMQTGRMGGQLKPREQGLFFKP